MLAVDVEGAVRRSCLPKRFTVAFIGLQLTTEPIRCDGSDALQ